MKIKPILYTILIFQSIACSKQPDGPKLENEYILFGHFYGFCVGESCIEIFKLTEGKLYEDDSDQYPNSSKPYEGNFIEMGNEKYQIVDKLFDKIPQELLAEQDTIIGSPDAADGGGIYFAIHTAEGTRYWLIDQMKNNVPNYLHPFLDEINSSISLISD